MQAYNPNVSSSCSLAGKTLFITGASRGIGKAIALRAARDGANIAIAAKTAEPHPKLPGTIYTAAQELEAVGGKCLPCVVDIRNDSELESAIAATVDKFGGIDILVNNASAISITGTTRTAMKRYDLMMDINTRGTFLASKLAIPHLLKSSNPHILNISPPLNMRPGWFANHCAYTIAKYGMSMCVLGMAEELKPQGIAVNALWPRTAIATAAVEMLGGDALVKMSRKPEIMADAAYCILTKDSKSLTGQFLIDDDVLKENGVTDLDQYANSPGHTLAPDYFLDEAESFKEAWSGSSSSGGVAKVFDRVKPLINSEIVGKIGATYKFTVSDSNEHWLLDLKNGSGSVGACDAGTEADVSFTSDSNVLVGMFSGEVSATSAFMSGDLQLKGDMVKAMSLEKLMKQVQSKL